MSFRHEGRRPTSGVIQFQISRIMRIHSSKGEGCGLHYKEVMLGRILDPVTVDGKEEIGDSVIYQSR